MLTPDASISRGSSVRFGTIFFTGIVLAGVSFLGVYHSLRAARSDYLYRLNTPESLKSAISLDPDNAAYHALLAENMESSGVDPIPQLVEAIRLSPLDSLAMLRIAIRAESVGDFATAEQYLKRAVAVDNKFTPRSALLNYYFRRDMRPEFWRAVTEAIRTASIEDVDGVFRLAWEMDPNQETLLSHIKPTRANLDGYLGFLLSTRKMEAAATVARRCAEVSDEQDKKLLLSFCERALFTDSESSVAVWNVLVARKLIPYEPLNPRAGAFLTNKTFLVYPTPGGFDWATPSVDGVYVSQLTDGQGASVHLTGTQPEDCVILQQFIPLAPGRRFRFSYEYSSPEDEKISGLQWEVSNADGMIATSPELVTTAGAKNGQLDFSADGGWAKLILRYKRTAGHVRAEGTVAIRKMTGQLVP